MTTRASTSEFHKPPHLWATASFAGMRRSRRQGKATGGERERAAVKGDRGGARLLVARARNQECRALANLGENERAKPVCEEARRIFAEAGDQAGLARALHAMAEVPLNQGDLV